MGNCICGPSKHLNEESTASKFAEVKEDFLESAPSSTSSTRVLGYTTPDINTIYTFGHILGKGKYGTVYLVTHNITGEEFACKCINKQSIQEPGDFRQIQREIEIWHLVSSDAHTVSLHSAHEDDTTVYLITDYCSGGALFDRIAGQGSFSEEDAAEHLRTMLGIVAHCHSLGVIHRDLKAENFLFADSSPNAVLKLTDFGLSTFFKEGQVFSECVGTPYCVAPEVLNKTYGKECDIWSLGIIIYTMLCGYPPFWGKTENDTYDMILHAPLRFGSKSWRLISDTAKDCISRMLNKDPAKRATVEQLLNHPWLRPGGADSKACLQHSVLHKLKHFSSMNRFAKQVMRVIASNLRPEELAGLQELFNTYDNNKQGAICGATLRTKLKRQGVSLTEKELEWIMGNVSDQLRGTIKPADFIAATMPMSRLQCKRSLHHAFKQLDRDDTGYITRAMLLDLFGIRSGDASEAVIVDEVLVQADKDGDGKIGFDDFCDLMRRSAVMTSVYE